MVLPILAAAAPGIAKGAMSLLGGILGRKSEKKAALEQFKLQGLMNERQFELAEEYRITPQKLRDEALAAGFNPLTVMGAGGLSTGVSPSMPTVPLGPSGALGRSFAEAGAGFGQALSGALSAPIEAETRALENSLLKTQIKLAENELSKKAPVPVAFNQARQRRVTTSPAKTSGKSVLDTGSSRAARGSPKGGPLVAVPEGFGHGERKMPGALVEPKNEDLPLATVDPMDPFWSARYGEEFPDVVGYLNVYDDAVRVGKRAGSLATFMLPTARSLAEGYVAKETVRKAVESAWAGRGKSGEAFRSRNRQRAGRSFLPTN